MGPVRCPHAEPGMANTIRGCEALAAGGVGSHSNSERGAPDCRMIDISVPMRSSR